MRRLFLTAIAVGFVSVACSSSTSDTTAPSDQPATTTTKSQTTTTTTTVAPTTTTTNPPETTTTAGIDAAEVQATPVKALLDPYNAAGGDLFPAGSVEANWYQWNGLYVVLYRGFDATDGSSICAGNSNFVSGSGYSAITNSPHNGAADEICVGAAKIAETPSGVQACDSLLYYVTEIATDSDGTLWGTLEIGDGEWAGQTSEILVDIANTPEFEPGMAAYELPPSGVDDGGIVMCG